MCRTILKSIASSAKSGNTSLTYATRSKSLAATFYLSRNQSSEMLRATCRFRSSPSSRFLSLRTLKGTISSLFPRYSLQKTLLAHTYPFLAQTIRCQPIASIEGFVAEKLGQAKLVEEIATTEGGIVKVRFECTPCIQSLTKH